MLEKCLLYNSLDCGRGDMVQIIIQILGDSIEIKETTLGVAYGDNKKSARLGTSTHLLQYNTSSRNRQQK